VQRAAARWPGDQVTETSGQKSAISKNSALCAVRFALCFTVAVLFALRVSAAAQTPGKIHKLGVLLPYAPGPDARVEAFRQALRELGYIEGKTINIEYRWADGKFENLPELAADLVRINVDVIIAAVTQASLAARKATVTIPIVMIGVSDPVGSRLVSSLARPGTNVTGTSSMTAQVVGKQLELLKDTLPKVSRIAALWNPANPVFQALQVQETEIAARSLGIRLHFIEARDADEIDRAFVTMARKGTRALIVLGDPVFISHRKRIADLAVKHRLPAVSGTRDQVESGGLMAYGPSFADMYRRTAYYVDRILKGAKPGDLPVEQPTKFELVINLKTARQIGLTISPNVLARADQVIK
jgi:putative tryptophan/tyrosine transport system substrate-binding protein